MQSQHLSTFADNSSPVVNRLKPRLHLPHHPGGCLTVGHLEESRILAIWKYNFSLNVHEFPFLVASHIIQLFFKGVSQTKAKQF